MAEQPKDRFPSAVSTVIALPVVRVGAPERAYLVVLAGPQVGAMYKLEPGRDLVIGRDPTVEINLTDDGVSRRHARLRLSGARAAIEDLGSRNGTFVAGERVERRELADGEKIQVGVATTIKFTMTDDLEEEYQQSLLEAALRDPLTGVYNRRHFDEQLAVEHSAARRHRSPLSLLLVDVDHFKLVNDRHGHLAGDAVLTLVAQVLVDAMRKEDTLARYGGEEFVILARGTDLAGAHQLGERIREQIADASCNWEGAALRVTVSVGVAELAAQASARDLLDAADRAVYRAKRDGRNCVRVASAEAPAVTS